MSRTSGPVYWRGRLSLWPRDEARRTRAGPGRAVDYSVCELRTRVDSERPARPPVENAGHLAVLSRGFSTAPIPSVSRRVSRRWEGPRPAGVAARACQHLHTSCYYY